MQQQTSVCFSDCSTDDDIDDIDDLERAEDRNSDESEIEEIEIFIPIEEEIRTGGNPAKRSPGLVDGKNYLIIALV